MHTFEYKLKIEWQKNLSHFTIHSKQVTQFSNSIRLHSISLYTILITQSNLIIQSYFLIISLSNLHFTIYLLFSSRLSSILFSSLPPPSCLFAGFKNIDGKGRLFFYFQRTQKEQPEIHILPDGDSSLTPRRNCITPIVSHHMIACDRILRLSADLAKIWHHGCICALKANNSMACGGHHHASWAEQPLPVFAGFFVASRSSEYDRVRVRTSHWSGESCQPV